MQHNTRGLTNNQKHYLARLILNGGTATTEQIKDWGFTLTTIRSVSRRGLAGYYGSRNRYEIDRGADQVVRVAVGGDAARWLEEHGFCGKCGCSRDWLGLCPKCYDTRSDWLDKAAVA